MPGPEACRNHKLALRSQRVSPLLLLRGSPPPGPGPERGIFLKFSIKSTEIISSNPQKTRIFRGTLPPELPKRVAGLRACKDPGKEGKMVPTERIRNVEIFQGLKDEELKIVPSSVRNSRFRRKAHSAKKGPGLTSFSSWKKEPFPYDSTKGRPSRFTARGRSWAGLFSSPRAVTRLPRSRLPLPDS